MEPPLSGARWLCCHLGAREHYAVPRALHRHQRLTLLVTDAWARSSLWSLLPGSPLRRLSERCHPELVSARVRAFTVPLLIRESVSRWRHRHGWEELIARNDWFGRRAAAALRDIGDRSDQETLVFAHSYSARDVFRYAKSRGWTTVLGQIDPGAEHFRIVEQLARELPEYGPAPAVPPPAYFESWREECALADWIVVNSEWSRDAMASDGVPAGKLRVVPLPFEPETIESSGPRRYPAGFTPERPLRALFVGHATVAKGVHALLESIELLNGVPIELTLVGDRSMTVPQRFVDHAAIHWAGAVPRLDVMRYYRQSDVLVFPSLSDGFGMAQVEAQGCGLPIIASTRCGRVVENGVNGLLLPEVTPQAIAGALRSVAANPRQLEAFSSRCRMQQDGMSQLGTSLLQLEPPS